MRSLDHSPDPVEPAPLIDRSSDQAPMPNRRGAGIGLTERLVEGEQVDYSELFGTKKRCVDGSR